MNTDDVASRVWRYLTFAAWTWSDRDEAARIRAGWPTWRKAVRPVGAAAVWVSLAAGFFANDPRNAASVPLIVIAALCAVYGIVDGAVMRRARKRVTQNATPQPVPTTDIGSAR